MSEMTMRNTKQEILDAYKKSLAFLNDKSVGQMDIEKEKELQAQTHFVANADLNMDFLTKFAGDAREIVSAFAEIKKAVQVKKEALLELTGIEAEAQSLAALIQTNKEMAEQFEVDKANRQFEWDSTDSDRNREIERAVEEHTYEWNRKKQTKKDTLSDELTEMRKRVMEELQGKQAEYRESVKELDARDQYLSEAEGELEKLRLEVSLIPTTIEEKVKAAVGKEKGMMERKFEGEKKFFERDIGAKLDVANSHVATLQIENDRLAGQVQTLTTKLELAHKEITNLATKTVEGAGNSTMFNEMKSLLAEKGSGK